MLSSGGCESEEARAGARRLFPRRTIGILRLVLSTIIVTLLGASEQACGEPLAEVRRSLQAERQTDSLSSLAEAVGVLEGRARPGDVDGRAHYDLAQKLSSLGAYYVRARDYDRALESVGEGIAAAEIAIARAPRSSERYRLSGDLHGQLAALGGFVGKIRNGRRAVTLYKRALSLDAGNPLAHVGLGIAALETPAIFGGSVEAALERFHRAQQLDPHCEMAWVWEGIAFRRQGDVKQARRMFRQALRANPNSDHARHELTALDELP